MQGNVVQLDSGDLQVRVTLENSALNCQVMTWPAWVWRQIVPSIARIGQFDGDHEYGFDLPE